MFFIFLPALTMHGYHYILYISKWRMIALYFVGYSKVSFYIIIISELQGTISILKTLLSHNGLQGLSCQPL